MSIAKLSPLVLSIAALSLWACSGDGSGGTGTTGTGSTGGVTTGGMTTGGTSGSTSGGTGGGLGIGAACTRGAMPDPCYASDAGLACTQGSDGTTYTCQLPGELSPCLTPPGCAVTIPPLSCDPGYVIGSENVSLCLVSCSFTNQCPDARTSCQNSNPMRCFYDFCGPGAPISNGTTYYAACNNGGTNNGTCLPLLGGSSPGICQAGGPVPPWQPCSDTRPDAGRSDLCGVGTTCVTFTMAGVGASTMCAPVCSPSGSGVSGPACATGETCVSAGPYGYCLTDCGGGQACPSPTSCKGIPVNGQTLQECLP